VTIGRRSVAAGVLVRRHIAVADVDIAAAGHILRQPGGAALQADVAAAGDLDDGLVAGVGNVAVFLPQLIILFTAIALLEDSGYMARAAFLLDRPMSRVGLHGKAFLPLMTSFACAIPGIAAAKTVEQPRDRARRGRRGRFGASHRPGDRRTRRRANARDRI
jgi:Fe2+ transport system protein B